MFEVHPPLSASPAHRWWVGVCGRGSFHSSSSGYQPLSLTHTHINIVVMRALHYAQAGASRVAPRAGKPAARRGGAGGVARAGEVWTRRVGGGFGVGV